jgi:hypothetical protein
MTVVFKVNMKNVGWDQCLCVNVTYDMGQLFQSKNEKPWVRWMFMWMLHSQSKYEKYRVRSMFMWMLQMIWDSCFKSF